MTQPDGGAGNTPETSDEAGAVDNRLSLNPNEEPWASKIKNWKDGERYKLSDLGNADILQISPGEFEVVKGEDSEVAGAKEPTGDDAATEKPASYDNPAIAKMMAGPKR